MTTHLCDTRGIELPTIPQLDAPLRPSAFKSDQEVRWCPGCGDHVLLSAVQGAFAGMQIPKENIVVVSGIGCSSRLPYYVDTYGMHSVHGRAPSIATGIAINRPDLSVWVVTGDGDALSIGGNHFIHAIRRNVNLKILLFNNQIYALTKGQFSPTSQPGSVTKTSPGGSIDPAFDPVSLAIGAGATFVARSTDSNRAHLMETLAAASAHQGTAVVEIYQNCNQFNDAAFKELSDPALKRERTIALREGEPIVFGAQREHAVVRDATGQLTIGSAQSPGVVVHDPTNPNPARAFALAQLSHTHPGHAAVGVFRAVEQQSFDAAFAAQYQNFGPTPPEAVASLLLGHDSWTVD